MYSNKVCDAIHVYEHQAGDLVIHGEQIHEHVAIYVESHSQDTPRGTCNIH